LCISVRPYSFRAFVDGSLLFSWTKFATVVPVDVVRITAGTKVELLNKTKNNSK
jgi:hypothetical protein